MYLYLDMFNQQLNAHVSLFWKISDPHLTTRQYICENVLNVITEQIWYVMMGLLHTHVFLSVPYIPYLGNNYQFLVGSYMFLLCHYYINIMTSYTYMPI